MWKLLALLQKNLVLTIPAAMVAGLCFGWLWNASPLKSAIVPLTFLMVYPMMVNLQLEKVFSTEGLRCQVVTLLINFAIIPFLAFNMGKLFFADEPLIILGLLLAALLPTSGMTITWTGFAGGDINAAIKMTVTGLVVGSVATPFYALWLMGAAIEIPLVDVFRQIAFIVFLPMLLGYITKKLLIRSFGTEKYQKDLQKKFPMLSSLGVLGIVFVAMALKSGDILGNPVMLLSFLAPLVLLYLINFMLSTVIGRMYFSRSEAIAYS